nr:cation transporter [Arthrobacter sp. ISL-28]
MYFWCGWAKTPFCWHWIAFFWNRTCRDEPHGCSRQVREHRVAPEAKRRPAEGNQIRVDNIRPSDSFRDARLPGPGQFAGWIEDLLSVLPPIAFLLAVRLIRRPPTKKHPYGYHRSVGIAHLVAAMALVAMGAFLIVDSAAGLFSAEHPTIGVLSCSGIPSGLAGSWSGRCC